MACNSEGFCFDGWDDLCSRVGNLCAEIEDTFGSLVTNQSRLVDQIAPVLEGVSDLPTCSRVFLDTTSGIFTNSNTPDSIPVGIHTFGGRVILDGQQVCLAIDLAGNGPTLAGDFINEDLQPTFDEGGAEAFLTLEAYVDGGCTKAMKIPSSVDTSFYFEDERFDAFDLGDQNNHTTLFSQTIPVAGWYMVESFIQLNVFTNQSDQRVIDLRVSRDTGAEFIFGWATGPTNLLNHGFPNAGVTRVGCLSAGDVISTSAAYQNGVDAIPVATHTLSRMSITYLGEGPDCT